MPRRTEHGPSARQLRVGEELRHALARIIERGELRDPALAGVSVTVTEVRASPDLKRATVFVMPLGGRDVEPVVEALGRAAPYLRRLIAREVQLRYAPDLAFRADPSFAEANRIASLLRDAGIVQGGEDGKDDGGDDAGGEDDAGDDAEEDADSRDEPEDGDGQADGKTSRRDGSGHGA